MKYFNKNQSEIILVTGPSRSGKSEWAEKLAQQQNFPVTYIATSVLTEDDIEWKQRIELHRHRRPVDWVTWEVPRDLAKAIATVKYPSCFLVDSLGTWIANLLEQDDLNWQQTETELLTTIAASESQIILVAEETGWGVVPAYPMGRLFRDRLGNLVRNLGQIASTVYLVTGGHVLNLSQLGQPLG